MTCYLSIPQDGADPESTRARTRACCGVAVARCARSFRRAISSDLSPATYLQRACKENASLFLEGGSERSSSSRGGRHAPRALRCYWRRGMPSPLMTTSRPRSPAPRSGPRSFWRVGRAHGRSHGPGWRVPVLVVWSATRLNRPEVTRAHALRRPRQYSIATDETIDEAFRRCPDREGV